MILKLKETKPDQYFLKSCIHPIGAPPSGTHWGFGRCWCRSRCCRHRRPPDSRRSLWSEGWGRASYRPSQTHNRAPGHRGESFILQYSHIYILQKNGPIFSAFILHWYDIKHIFYTLFLSYRIYMYVIFCITFSLVKCAYACMVINRLLVH